MRINYLVTSISMATTAASSAATTGAGPTATATAAVSYASDTVAPAPTTPAPITAPAPPPSLLPPLGWCVVVWVVLCTRTLHLAGYWVVVDMCTRIVLKVEFNLGSGVLGVGFWGSGGWVFTLVCYRGLQGFEDYAGCCGGFYGGMLSLIRQLVCAPSTVVVVLMF